VRRGDGGRCQATSLAKCGRELNQANRPHGQQEPPTQNPAGAQSPSVTQDIRMHSLIVSPTL
jgi:hypothetical protein